ncbi:MAG: hypothetical protein K1W35_09775 [Lachnospiraceae bacterium]
MKRNKELFIEYIGQIAQEDWRRRHICLPSIVIAIALEAIDWEKNEDEIKPNELFVRLEGFHADSPVLRHVIIEHNNYLVTWRDPSQESPNWIELIGESNYIRAVQSLLDPKYPYCEAPEYDRRLVEIIEKYKLTVYDE